jgi:hypothetical protein
MFHKIQQLLLDTVSHLPELKMLWVSIRDWHASLVGLANFKPAQRLRYVEELKIDQVQYVLEKDGDRPVRYRRRWE